MPTEQTVRIVHYFAKTNLEEGGTVRAALDLCSVMARRGHEVRLVTHDVTDAPQDWDGSPGLPRVMRIDTPTRPGRRYARKQLAQAAAAIKGADVVHLHGMWVPSNPQIAAICRRYDVGYVLSVHGMLDDWSMAQRTLKKRAYLALSARRMIKGAGAIHTTAEGEKSQASKWLGSAAAKAQIIPYVVDLSAYDELPGPLPARAKFELGARPVVLFLSRVHYKKAPEVLVEAAAILKGGGKDCEFIIAGTGEDDYVAQIQTLIHKNNVADRVRLVGMVKGELKISLYEAADVFALPTQQENFGLVYVEALACATPVVATKGTDIWRELEETGGAVIAEGTPRAFAAAIGALIADPLKLAHMGQEGREGARKWLDIDTVAARFEAMYEIAGSAP